MTTIRRAEPGDLEAITEIYNEAILNTTATFDTEPKGLDEQTEWFEGHGPGHPLLVAEQDESVIGWASLSPWSDRCAYSDTAEISLYVADVHRGKGVGRTLMDAILEQGRRVGFHTLIARIATVNDASVRLHASAGFEPIGTMREVGRKFGRLHDVLLMQLIYAPSSPADNDE